MSDETSLRPTGTPIGTVDEIEAPATPQKSPKAVATMASPGSARTPGSEITNFPPTPEAVEAEPTPLAQREEAVLRVV